MSPISAKLLDCDQALNLFQTDQEVSETALSKTVSPQINRDWDLRFKVRVLSSQNLCKWLRKRWRVNEWQKAKGHIQLGDLKQRCISFTESTIVELSTTPPTKMGTVYINTENEWERTSHDVKLVKENTRNDKGTCQVQCTPRPRNDRM